jgi:hypothetical protein
VSHVPWVARQEDAARPGARREEPIVIGDPGDMWRVDDLNPRASGPDRLEDEEVTASKVIHPQRRSRDRVSICGRLRRERTSRLASPPGSALGDLLDGPARVGSLKRMPSPDPAGRSTTMPFLCPVTGSRANSLAQEGVKRNCHRWPDMTQCNQKEEKKEKQGALLT